jgi:hypothetical protein
MSRTASSANSRGVAVLSAAFAAAACTSMLGIDGDYYADRTSVGGASTGGKVGSGGKTSTPSRTGGSSGTPHHDAGPLANGGVVGKGGTPPSSGGSPDASAGGTTNEGSGGTEASGGTASGGQGGGTGGTLGAGGSGGNTGNGGAAPDDAGVCPIGTFTGTYKGMHRPSTGGTAVTAPIAGGITFHFSTTTSATTRTVTGTLGFAVGNTEAGGIIGTFRGSFDCTTEHGSVTLLMGTTVTTIVPPINGPVDGTFDIELAPNGGLSGTFQIREQLNPSFAIGSGTWSAK